MLDKIFGWGKKKDEPNPDILFGRYSDNNKPVAKVSRWTDADNFFKEKKYPESLDAFFEYLRDDDAQNVVYERNGAEGRFHFYQGSKIVRGTFNKEQLGAEVTLAKMPQPSVPVMRRLLEMNFNLYYSRYALDNDRLCMRFDSDIAVANPSKLYYGLKELGTKADKQDDLLVQDFTVLQATDSEHISEIPQQEKEVKYEYLQKWLKQTLDTITSLDADKFSGGIAYLLLSLAYRIDYLLAPEGNLLHDIEKIVGVYFLKDERPTTEKNRDMIEELKKLQARKKEEIFPFLFRSRYTFAIVAPQNQKAIADAIHGANQNMTWYRDNNYPFIASQIVEYGIAYCQYSFSQPKAITELFHLFMMINYSNYFEALGFKEKYYDLSSQRFAQGMIIERIKQVQEKWRTKYPYMNFRTENLNFASLVNFNLSFTGELELLNMEVK
ncbi:MAG: hypothetical protein ACHQEB_02435 [Chitinophagales bacterium]